MLFTYSYKRLRAWYDVYCKPLQCLEISWLSVLCKLLIRFPQIKRVKMAILLELYYFIAVGAFVPTIGQISKHTASYRHNIRGDSGEIWMNTICQRHINISRLRNTIIWQFESGFIQQNIQVWFDLLADFGWANTHILSIRQSNRPWIISERHHTALTDCLQGRTPILSICWCPTEMNF